MTPDLYTEGAARYSPEPTAGSRSRSASRDDAYAWERAREALDKSGSFHAFDEAMRWLSDTDPLRHSLIWHVLCCREPVRLIYPHAIDDALDVLGSRMPERVVVPYWLLPEHAARGNARARRRARGRHADQGVQSERDREIIGRYLDGETVGDLARAYGVSAGRVSQIVAGVRRARLFCS